MMERRVGLLNLAIALLAASTVVAAPLNVRTLGTKGQETFMCADCKSKVSCAHVGD
jgi:hypothetical protein